MIHKVDILLATYNGEKYLEAQLESLLLQTYKDFKIIVHDDNSTDNTVKIIREYTQDYPDKFIFIDDTISYANASANFNFLLTQSHAEYIMFCDQDDVWLAQKVERSIKVIKTLESQHPSTATMVFSDLEVVDENLKVLAKSMWSQQKLNPHISQNLDDLLALNVVSGCTMMFNKHCHKFISPIPHHDITHDHWVAVNIARYGYISFIKEALIQYRQHPDNTIGAQSQGVQYFFFKIIHLFKTPTKFFKKYSYFNFPINLQKVFFNKLILNFKRLF